MSDMFWIALEVSIPKIGFYIMSSLTVEKVDAFKFDGVAESDNTASWVLFTPVRETRLRSVTQGIQPNLS